MAVTKEKLEQIFKVYDDKRNGAIKSEDIGTPAAQLGKLIRSARLFPSEEDIVQLRNRVDPKRTGTFTMSSFVEVALAFADKQSHVRHDEQLMKAFSFFDESINSSDSEGDGEIQESELRKIMSSFAEPLTQEEIKDIMKYARPREGRINYRDFIRTILSGKLQ